MNFFKNMKWYHTTIAVMVVLIIILIFCAIRRQNTVKQQTQNIPRLSNIEKETRNPENSVDTFNKESFNGGSNGLPKMEIVLYYASWCGYSRQFLPEWEKFVDYAKTNFPDIKVTTRRCEGGMENACLQKGIEGYPTVVLYKGDTEIQFTKGRTTNNLIKFIEENQ